MTKKTEQVEAVENQTEETAATENTSAQEPAKQSGEVDNIVQALDIYNQAVQVGQTKGIYQLEDSEVIARAKRFATGFTMKEKLKVNFNNSFFTQVEKQVQGPNGPQTVYNYEPVTLEPTKSAKKSVSVYEIEETVLFFTNDQVFQAVKGDTVLEFEGSLFFKPSEKA